jgi:transcriptional regulator with PAS, ATPase and Fis domain
VNPNEPFVRILSEGGESSRAMVAEDPRTHNVLAQAENVAATMATVLLMGESGSGKEVFARHIHRMSDRAEQAFVCINCAALPASLLESELFGHEKGAFSGAVRQHKGHFERANGGTILLDEISEMDIDLQAKLLRVLQERQILRVGGSRSVSIDVRVVATTNRDLMQEVQDKRFRLDLFYRLNAFPIFIPPLRERSRDVIPLTRFYLRALSKQLGVEVRGISHPALKQLAEYSFPGNVRELINILERASILCSGSGSGVITSNHLMLNQRMPMTAVTGEYAAPPAATRTRPGPGAPSSYAPPPSDAGQPVSSRPRNYPAGPYGQEPAPTAAPAYYHRAPPHVDPSFDRGAREGGALHHSEADLFALPSRLGFPETEFGAPQPQERPLSMFEAVPAREQYAAIPSPLQAPPDQSHQFVTGLEDPSAFVVVPGEETLEAVEQKLILRSLERFGGNRTKTAEALGVSVRTIRNKLGRYRKLGIEVPD